MKMPYQKTAIENKFRRMHKRGAAKEQPELRQEISDALYWRCFKKGENLMPCDCAQIIGKRRLKKHGLEECARILVDLMERCGFYCDIDEAKFSLEIL